MLLLKVSFCCAARLLLTLCFERTNIAESLNRIKERARGCEVGITIEYLTALRDAYEDFIDDISRVIPVIRVDWSKFRTAEEMVRDAVSQITVSLLVPFFFVSRHELLRASTWR